VSDSSSFINFSFQSIASNSAWLRAGKANKHMHSWMMADSMDSGHGSAPLSDTYVTIGVGAGSRKGKGQQVKAPEGSAHLEVQCLSCVALAREKSVQVAAPRPPLVNVPPGVRPLAGCQYEVLPTVVEWGEKELVQQGSSSNLSGKVIGSQDITAIQAGSKAVLVVKAGQKRSATSEAPGDLECIHTPPHHVSAVNFSPMHFDEPQSRNLLEGWQGTVA